MSEVKVNKISPRTNCGTVQLGDSGDTITIPAGATQTGVGRQGTVDWDTTAKTTSFTAVSGNGYFVNTTSGAVTMTLPASPSAGDIVGVNDYARTFATNNLTVARNGSNIQGVATDGTISTNGQSTMFVYVDGTKGWIPTEDQTTTNYGELYVTATGGTVTTSGDYKIHTFTSPGTFCVSCAGNAAGSNTVDYLVIAGGGGAAMRSGGGGGAGGYRFSDGTASGCYSAGPSPLGASALPVSVQCYPVTVGAGGAGVPAPAGTSTNATNGANSIFSTITSQGGGGSVGHAASPPSCVGSISNGAGGSGSGGSAGNCANSLLARNGNTPPVSPPQGNNGGAGKQSPGAQIYTGGGGGGAGAAGVDGKCSSPLEGGISAGGAGLTSCITGSPVTRGGGGGGGTYTNTGSTYATSSGAGGSGGGGPAGQYNNAPLNPGAGNNGTANTGGGGGGSIEGPPGNPVTDWDGGSGGSGIVIIRYKYQ
jgi:hypothetical protein